MQLIEHRFEELSHLQYRVFTCQVGGKHDPTILVLKFSGAYGIGSEGNCDATLMQAITNAALSTWYSHAIVFDLREMRYEWGDAIWRVFGRGAQSHFVEGLPIALVVSDLCRSGFMSCQVLVPPIFDDLESAIAFVSEPARNKLKQLLAKTNLASE